MLIVPGPRQQFGISTAGEPCGGVFLETSLVVAADRRTDWAAFETLFRDWVVFDSFIFDDWHPLSLYNAGVLGKRAWWDPGSPVTGVDTSDTFRRVDYRDVSYHVYFPKRAAFSMDYRDAWSRYRRLSPNQKALIEYQVSQPAVDLVGVTGTRTPISTAHLWKVVHACTVLAHLLGTPEQCSGSGSPCPACGRTPPPHDRESRRKWMRTRLAQAVPPALLEDYVATVEAAFRLRHRVAHAPQPDETGIMPVVPGFTEIYDVERIVAEAEIDQVALDALSDNARLIGRSLLLRELFGFDYLPPLGRRMVTRLDFPASVSDADAIDSTRTGPA